MQRGEYDFARHLNERTKGSYRIDDYVALKREGVFDFVDGDTTLLSVVKVVHLRLFHEGYDPTKERLKLAKTALDKALELKATCPVSILLSASIIIMASAIMPKRWKPLL